MGIGSLVLLREAGPRLPGVLVVDLVEVRDDGGRGGVGQVGFVRAAAGDYADTGDQQNRHECPAMRYSREHCGLLTLEWAKFSTCPGWHQAFDATPGVSGSMSRDGTRPDDHRRDLTCSTMAV